jgi:hypothetical protein
VYQVAWADNNLEHSRSRFPVPVAPENRDKYQQEWVTLLLEQQLHVDLG